MPSIGQTLPRGERVCYRAARTGSCSLAHLP